MLLHTTVPTKKTGNSGKVPMARPKTCQKWIRRAKCERSLETGGRTWNIDPGSVRKVLVEQSDLYRQNAENCMRMAKAAKGEPAYNEYKR